ncbi:hypothetical protein OIU78_022760 [Salix suchowensis]|nr:hypothetical protein OIU78_022760 [Salix suchowensis]
MVSSARCTQAQELESFQPSSQISHGGNMETSLEAPRDSITSQDGHGLHRPLEGGRRRLVHGGVAHAQKEDNSAKYLLLKIALSSCHFSYLGESAEL